MRDHKVPGREASAYVMELTYQAIAEIAGYIGNKNVVPFCAQNPSRTPLCWSTAPEFVFQLMLQRRDCMFTYESAVNSFSYRLVNGNFSWKESSTRPIAMEAL